MLNSAQVKPNLYVFLSGNTLYTWQFEMLSNLLASHSIERIYWVSLSGNNKKTPAFVSFLYFIDGFLAQCKLSPLAPKKIEVLAESGVETRQLSLADYFDRLSCETTSSAWVVNTTEQNLPESILSQTPMPVYSVFFGNNPRSISSMAGIFEFIQGKKTISSGIQIENFKRTNKGSINTLVFSSETSLESVSLCRTTQICLQKTATFLSRFLSAPTVQDDQHSNFPGALQKINPELTQAIIGPAQQTLGIKNTLILGFRYSNRVFRRIFDKLTISEQWILLLGKNIETGEANEQFSSFVKLIPPGEEFWADPFIYTDKPRKNRNDKNIKNYLFFEVFPYKRNLGHIACMEILDDGSHSEPVKILERPYHLSYPNVFEYEGSHYMIPETGDNETIELYEATAFPYEWKFKHCLMHDIRAYDSSLLQHEGKWWLFAAVAVNEQCPTTEELYLFYADSPISENWHPHIANPVVSDAASARPAGKIFCKNKAIIRPSQDCSGSYGAGINLCEITSLNTHTYQEKIIRTFYPDWNKKLSGIHTYNFNEKFTVSDAIFRRGKRA